MNGNRGATNERDALLEDLSARLTAAVYPVVLCRGVSGSWIDLELALWRELAGTVQQWADAWPPGGPSDNRQVWRECFLKDLGESAFCVAVRHGPGGSLRELGQRMWMALESVLEKATAPEQPVCPYQFAGRLLTGQCATVCAFAGGSCPLQEVRPTTGGRYTTVCLRPGGVVSEWQQAGH